jgi:broad specificity phosphatase PhoE
MSRLWLLRHARTAWNAERRLQGRTDVPLDEVGRASLAGRRLPDGLATAQVDVSPLLRAQQTATLVGVHHGRTQPMLVEMNWGEWEGQTVTQLRKRLGERMRANEDRGLDFQPPNGESPRQVQHRLRPWLAEVANADADRVAVTHKGVIRAILALAYEWDMLGRAPARLDYTCLQGFEVTDTGLVHPAQLNVPLADVSSPRLDATVAQAGAGATGTLS